MKNKAKFKVVARKNVFMIRNELKSGTFTGKKKRTQEKESLQKKRKTTWKNKQEKSVLSSYRKVASGQKKKIKEKRREGSRKAKLQMRNLRLLGIQGKCTEEEVKGKGQTKQNLSGSWKRALRRD